ncbi:hypothetical protein [Shouchella clausii]|jgi:hypothetical protein|uniref:hypothetical protein n=1 Tax=Shouchella clausii TaxID=79880 RepID=UPI000BA67210|nr:hypothetical protein [Shouchella clausii]PAD17101.1 hypothetical protein CHH73_10360 [Shouchella clausii]
MKLKPFNLQDLPISHPFFIAHLYDRVLVGREGEAAFSKLEEAVEQDNVLEVHLFNEGVEVYAARIDDHLVEYETLQPLNPSDKQVVERVYKLERLARPYNKLRVKEYIDFDENHLAYVKQTILCSLEIDKGKEA